MTVSDTLPLIRNSTCWLKKASGGEQMKKERKQTNHSCFGTQKAIIR